ncbi:MAG: helix-turn-helix transcriptional regulator [Alphaproteobacteria bacterium]|nr:helix-turn-helix transcriptional regulator [Alphaproteobacteria bacterium]
MDICTLIGTNIRKLRNSKKLSQEELAFRAEIDRSYLSEIENGYKNLSVVMLERIATALDVKITALFSGHK